MWWKAKILNSKKIYFSTIKIFFLHLLLVHCLGAQEHKSLPCRAEKRCCPLHWGVRDHLEWDTEKLNKFSGLPGGTWGAPKSRQTYSQAGKEMSKTAARRAACFPQKLLLELVFPWKISIPLNFSWKNCLAEKFSTSSFDMHMYIAAKVILVYYR